MGWVAYFISNLWIVFCLLWVMRFVLSYYDGLEEHGQDRHGIAIGRPATRLQGMLWHQRFIFNHSRFIALGISLLTLLMLSLQTNKQHY